MGPAKGYRWLVGSGVHGFWLGLFEIEKRRAFERVLSSGDVVYDIGANVGYYSLVSAALVGPRGSVVAFEPLPENVEFLRAHVERNSLQTVTIFESAVSDQNGQVRFRFDSTDSRSEGRLSPDGNLHVRSMRLDDLVGSGAIRPPQCIKIDVEGGEMAVLFGAEELFRAHRPVVFVETVGTEATAWLVARGYQVFSINEDSTELVGIPGERVGLVRRLQSECPLRPAAA
jgi:FkbM family methyltransferase